jgi:hypothetical protein
MISMGATGVVGGERREKIDERRDKRERREGGGYW